MSKLTTKSGKPKLADNEANILQSMQKFGGLDFTIDPAMFAEGFTQSEMQLMDDCGEAWYLRYNLGLAKHGSFSWALTYGSAIHSFLEEFYTTGGKRWSFNLDIDRKKIATLPLSVMEDLEYWQKLGQIQSEIYASYYKQDHLNFTPVEDGVERIADMEFEGIRLKGMLDLFFKHVAYKGYYMLDHKTAGRIDAQTVLGWDFRFQFMFYCWLAWKIWPQYPVKGYFINAIKKPALRQGKAETLPALMARIRADMLGEPEKYFYRDRLLLTKDALQRFEDQVLRPKLHRIRLLIDPKISDDTKISIIRNKNTNHCLAYGQSCQFLGACQHGLDIEINGFMKRAAKHEELVEAE